MAWASLAVLDPQSVAHAKLQDNKGVQCLSQTPSGQRHDATPSARRCDWQLALPYTDLTTYYWRS